MSDKIQYSDRDDYVKNASDVLFYNVLRLINLRQENKLTEEQQSTFASYNFTSAEMALLEHYNTYYNIYRTQREELYFTEMKIQIQEKNYANAKSNKFEKNLQLRRAEKRIAERSKANIENLQQIKSLIEKRIAQCKEILAHLEIRSEMQDILNRFSKPYEEIQLTFANEFFGRIKKAQDEQRNDRKDTVICIVTLFLAISLILCLSYIFN